MRFFTVKLDGDPNPDRARVVLAIRQDGALLIADEDDGGRLRWVTAAETRISVHYMAQDEREWWGNLGPRHEH